MILMMDATEDVIDGAMCKQLHKADLNMKEVVFSQTRTKGPKTYFRGSVAIGGIWVTEELEVRQPQICLRNYLGGFQRGLPGKIVLGPTTDLV